MDMQTSPSDLIRHTGADYHALCRHLSRVRSTITYFEIGVQVGIHLAHVHCDYAIAVDPVFQLSVNVMQHKKTLELHQVTSDRFFADPPPSLLGGRRIDLAFLDGYHTFEFLLRDFYNTERFASKNALVMMHDCLPMNEEMADRNETRAYERGKNTAHPSHWTGDVWKVIGILQRYRPDLMILGVRSPPTGVVCVSGLDPASRILEENYFDIIGEFANIPNDAEHIAACYSKIQMVDAEVITKEMDHSLYFRT